MQEQLTLQAKSIVNNRIFHPYTYANLVIVSDTKLDELVLRCFNNCLDTFFFLLLFELNAVHTIHFVMEFTQKYFNLISAKH